jgi:hypothetical protein
MEKISNIVKWLLRSDSLRKTLKKNFWMSKLTFNVKTYYIFKQPRTPDIVIPNLFMNYKADLMTVVDTYFFVKNKRGR